MNTTISNGCSVDHVAGAELGSTDNRVRVVDKTVHQPDEDIG
jgi:hypothetical protein